MKIRPVGTELFHADGQAEGRTDWRTDMTKIVVAFRKFCEKRLQTYSVLNQELCNAHPEQLHA